MLQTVQKIADEIRVLKVNVEAMHAAHAASLEDRTAIACAKMLETLGMCVKAPPIGP